MTSPTTARLACPTCGNPQRTLKVTVQQYVLVDFEPANGEDHEVIDRPEGDMEFDGDSIAYCSRCSNYAPLKDFGYE